jgi:hypothetical protein
MQILPFQMANFIDLFNSIAMIERFNHEAMMQGCDYTGIEVNIAFRVLYISIVESDLYVLSLMMGESLGQVVLPPRFSNVFHTTDLYRIKDR